MSPEGWVVVWLLVWGLAQHGIAEDTACTRAKALLEDLGIAHVARRAAHRLSFGERKRLSFAAALSTGPSLLPVMSTVMVWLAVPS